MARIKYSALVSSISGSIGSTTFQNTRSGKIVRNKPRPNKTATSTQLERRSLMMSLHYAWSNLTDDQRYVWEKFIDYSGASIARDKTIKLTGHGLFLKYNFLRILTGRGITSTVYYSPMSEIPFISYLSIVSTHLTIAFTGYDIGDTIWFVLKLTTARPQSQRFNPRGIRYIETYFSQASVFNIDDAYLAIFGEQPANGSFIHYSVQFFNLDSPVIAGKLTGVIKIQ